MFAEAGLGGMNQESITLQGEETPATVLSGPGRLEPLFEVQRHPVLPSVGGILKTSESQTISPYNPLPWVN